LLAQGEVLDGELAVATAEEGEEAKQVEQRADHGRVIVLGSAAKDQPLAWRTEFWRRTGRTRRPDGSRRSGDDQERSPSEPSAMKRPIAEAMSGATETTCRLRHPAGFTDGLPFRYEIRS